MEGNSNKCLQYPCSFPPPTWVDPYQPCSSCSSSVPKWVIAAIFIAVAILVFFLFWYIRSREKKPKDGKQPPEKDDQKQKDKKPKAPPTPQEQIYVPNTCQSCGHAAGIYAFTYLCPWCKYKAEYALAYPGPSGKK